MRAILSTICVLGTGLAGAGCGASDLSLPSDGRTVDLRAISGGGQEGTVGTSLPEPLVVGVRDGSGNPVADVRLVFRFRDEFPDARINPADIQTDDRGEASVHVRLGSTPGSQTVEATVAEDVAPDQRAFVRDNRTRAQGRGPGWWWGQGEGKGEGQREGLTMAN